MGHHLLHEYHDPLVPGMPPMLTRVLAVLGDTARLDFTILHRQGYQVTCCTDPAVAMAELQGLKFHVVMVDYWHYPGSRGAAVELLKWAIGEPHLCAYAISEQGGLHGPLDMNDFSISRKVIHNVASNGQKSPQATPNSLYNTSPSTTASTITNSPSSERRKRSNRKHLHDTDSQEVEQDGEDVEENDQPAKKPKKDRFVWTDELHNEFVEAHDQLLAKGAAVPKKILDLMKDPTLTRENIASHLQKHRLNLQREACTDPPRRSHSRTKHHISTTQASFSSPNMSSQQQAPTVVQSRSATVVNCMVFHVQTFKATDKSNKSVLADVPPKDIYPGTDDPTQSSVRCVDNSDGNILQEDLSAILNKEPECSWEHEYLSRR